MVFWKSLWYNLVNYSFAKLRKEVIMATKRTRSAKNKKVAVSDRSLGGFTIIEVVLVLAIAGLIFMMVFIALPQLQRSQRDTQRRQDLADLQAAVTNFQGNNNGKIPGEGKFEGDWPNGGKCETGDNRDACRLIVVYMNGVNATENKFLDPQGEPYKLSVVPCGGAGAGDAGTTCGALTTIENTAFDDHRIFMVTKAKCNGEDVVPANNSRDYALVTKLEGSGIYCHDNNQ